MNQLSEYIRQARDAGLSDHQIQQRLLESGWPQSSIDVYLFSHSTELTIAQSDPTFSLPSSSHSYLRLLIATLIGGGVLVTAVIFYLYTPYSKTNTAETLAEFKPHHQVYAQQAPAATVSQQIEPVESTAQATMLQTSQTISIPQPSPSPITLPNNWQWYDAGELGFKIGYPANWYVEQYAPDANVAFTHIIFSPKPLPTTLNKVDLVQVVRILISKTSNPQGMQQIQDGLISQGLANPSHLSGVLGYESNGTTFVSHNNWVYEFSHLINQTPDHWQQSPISQQMLKTWQWTQ